MYSEAFISKWFCKYITKTLAQFKNIIIHKLETSKLNNALKCDTYEGPSIYSNKWPIIQNVPHYNNIIIIRFEALHGGNRYRLGLR